MATKDPTRGLPLKSSKQTRGMTPKYVPSTKSVPTSGKGPSMAPKETKSVSSLAVADAMAKIRAASEDVRKATGRHIDPKQMEVLMTAALTNPDGAGSKAVEIARRLTGEKIWKAEKPEEAPKQSARDVEIASAKKAIKEYENDVKKPAPPGLVDAKKKEAAAASNLLKEKAATLPPSPARDSVLSRLNALDKNINESLTADRLDSILGILSGGITKDVEVLAKSAADAEAQKTAQTPAPSQPQQPAAPSQPQQPAAPPQQQTAAPEPTVASAEPKETEKPLTDQVTSSNIGSPSADPADKKPDDLQAMDINIADNAMTKSDMGPCSKCPRRDERMEAMREVSDLMGNKPSEIKALAMGDKSGSEGKCQGSCVRKVGNDWRVVSNKTGKLWPAKYGTEEKAKAALAAYHIK